MNPRASTRVACRLVVLEGDDRGRSCRVGMREIVVGTGAGVDLMLTDARISAYHCAVRADVDGSILLRDLGSTNGTWLAGRRITVETPVALGTTVLVGKTAVRIEPASQPAVAAAVPEESDAPDTVPTSVPTSIPSTINVRSNLPYADARLSVLSDFERIYTAAIVTRANGDVAAAADSAGIDEDRLRALITEHDLGALVRD